MLIEDKSLKEAVQRSQGYCWNAVLTIFLWTVSIACFYCLSLMADFIHQLYSPVSSVANQARCSRLRLDRAKEGRRG
jgi:hypothetical protein